MLRLRAGEAPLGSAQTRMFDAAAGSVDNGSPAHAKVAFYRALLAARADVYAVRWVNTRTGRSG